MVDAGTPSGIALRRILEATNKQRLVLVGAAEDCIVHFQVPDVGLSGTPEVADRCLASQVEVEFEVGASGHGKTTSISATCC